MFGGGPGWHFFEIWGVLASWVAGFIFFLVWLAIVILFVRFLLIATRAAKVYLRNNGAHDGILPNRPVGSAAPAAAPATTTKPAARTPKPKP